MPSVNATGERRMFSRKPQLLPIAARLTRGKVAGVAQGEDAGHLTVTVRGDLLQAVNYGARMPSRGAPPRAHWRSAVVSHPRGPQCSCR
jgi:hypothetical protein